MPRAEQPRRLDNLPHTAAIAFVRHQGQAPADVRNERAAGEFRASCFRAGFAFYLPSFEPIFLADADPQAVPEPLDIPRPVMDPGRTRL
jgi:hypothetical protein